VVEKCKNFDQKRSKFGQFKNDYLNFEILPNLVNSHLFLQNDPLRPFESIPAPSGGWLPFIGHGMLMVKKPAGMEQTWKNIADLVSIHRRDDNRWIVMGMVAMKGPHFFH
jgi:hypothetical protein